jgi:hypothetical protein
MAIVNVKASVNKKRIDQILTNLKESATVRTLYGIKLQWYADKALGVLRRYFPGPNKQTHSVDEFGGHLSKGWFADASWNLTSGAIIALKNKFARKDRAKKVLEKLDFGSGAFSYIAPKYASFDGKDGEGQGHIYRGQEVFRSGRPGAHYTDKTFHYINATLLPMLRRRIAEEVKKKAEA